MCLILSESECEIQLLKEYSKHRNYQEKHYSSTHDHSEARKRLAGSHPVHSGDVQDRFLSIMRPSLSTSTVFSFTVGVRYYRRHKGTRQSRATLPDKKGCATKPGDPAREWREQKEMADNESVYVLPPIHLQNALTTPPAYLSRLFKHP